MRRHDTERADMRRLNYFEDERSDVKPGNATSVYALPEYGDEEEEDVRVSPMQQDNSDGRLARPGSIRTITDPSPAALLQGYFAINAAAVAQPTATRNRSPFSKSHLRSRSSGAAANLPKMVRAHSMPAVHSLTRVYEQLPVASSASTSGSQSPQPSPARLRSPLATPDTSHAESSYFPPPPRSPHWFETANGGPIEIIQEDSELDLTPRNSSTYSPSMPNPPPMALATRSAVSSSTRRRPVSPLHSATGVTSAPVIASPEQDSSSPAFPPTKFTESFPTSFQLHHYASTSSFSSISTPSSARSRSPSITSLETIEDVPDAEYEALEADRLWRLQLDSKGERGDDMSDDGYRRKGFGFGRGRNSERKRWSVCGGERRADLDLETIWED